MLQTCIIPLYPQTPVLSRYVRPALTLPFVSKQREGQEIRFICRCSFLEIYKEVITDLLNPAATRLPIREDFRQGVHVEGLQEEVTSSGSYPTALSPVFVLFRAVLAWHLFWVFGHYHVVCAVCFYQLCMAMLRCLVTFS